MNILVTGAAGFIGMHVVQRLAARGDRVEGIDNLNAYYDPALKEARLARLAGLPGFRFERMDVADGPRSTRCSRARSSTAWCTWPPRPACATRSRTRRPTAKPTCRAS
jgi:nucleoside-diphosphate-sugar epimerase